MVYTHHTAHHTHEESNHRIGYVCVVWFGWGRVAVVTLSEVPMEEDLTAGLASAINALPEMTEKKRSVDMHTNLATALVNEIKVGGCLNSHIHHHTRPPRQTVCVRPSVCVCVRLVSWTSITSLRTRCPVAR